MVPLCTRAVRFRISLLDNVRGLQSSEEVLLEVAIRFGSVLEHRLQRGLHEGLQHILVYRIAKRPESHVRGARGGMLGDAGAWVDGRHLLSRHRSVRTRCPYVRFCRDVDRKTLRQI